MNEDMSFESFEDYYQNSFEKDLERLKGKPFQGEFENPRDELYYAAAYYTRMALLEIQEEEELPPIDVKKYGIDFFVALGIAVPVVESTLEDEELCSLFQQQLLEVKTREFPDLPKSDDSEANALLFFYETVLGKENLDKLVQQIEGEMAIAKEIRKLQFPTGISYKGYHYVGPYPKDYFFGIDNMQDLVDTDLGEPVRFIKISITMSTAEDALKLAGKILRNANLQVQFHVDGYFADKTAEFRINYTPQKITVKYRKLYDNTPFLIQLTEEINKKYGTNYDAEDDSLSDLPQDDADTLQMIVEGCHNVANLCSDMLFMDSINENPPYNYEDLMQAWVDANQNHPFKDIADLVSQLKCGPAYRLAYYMTHYDVQLDTEEKEMEI